MQPKYRNARVCLRPQKRLSELRYWLTVAALLLVVGSSYIAAPLTAAQREFPDWDQGVYAEINRRHGEQAAQRMIDVVQFVKVHLNDPVEVQLEAVNDYMNEMTWIADSELWKQPDYWATPFETITTFGGDCEDIAIAKYLVLLLLGVPDEHMGFAHVITSEKEHHMVLLYRASENDSVLILDNKDADVKAAKERPDLIGVYIFRNDGTVFTIKDEGDARRSVKDTLENKRLEKWQTAKARSRENTKSYIPFNGGKPLAPDWLREYN